MEPFIRRAVPEDLEYMTRIEKRCFHPGASYPREQIEYLAFRANSSCFVVEHSGDVVGFIIVLYNRGKKVAGIETLDVDPSYRGAGLGEMLLLAAEDDMRKRGIIRARLEVSEGNTPAVSLYKKTGYSVLERLKEYYQYEHNGTRDALRMIKDITPEPSA